MLTCKQVLEELSNFLDDDVSAELRQALEYHLARCRCCKVVFDTTRRTLVILSDVEVFELPVAASARLHARIPGLLAGNP